MAEKMGILGRKLGMTRIFAGDGSAVAVTVVQAERPIANPIQWAQIRPRLDLKSVQSVQTMHPFAYH